jgi:hypothetical protein
VLLIPKPITAYDHESIQIFKAYFDAWPRRRLDKWIGYSSPSNRHCLLMVGWILEKLKANGSLPWKVVSAVGNLDTKLSAETNALSL